MGGFAAQKREFERWPQYKKLYTRAFDAMLEARKADGKTNHNRLWVDGQGVFDWWTGKDSKSNADQITLQEILEEE